MQAPKIQTLEKDDPDNGTGGKKKKNEATVKRRDPRGHFEMTVIDVN